MHTRGNVGFRGQTHTGEGKKSPTMDRKEKDDRAIDRGRSYHLKRVGLEGLDTHGKFLLFAKKKKGVEATLIVFVILFIKRVGTGVLV